MKLVIKIAVIYLTKIPTEQNFSGDLGYTVRNKVSKIPIDHMCVKTVIRS